MRQYFNIAFLMGKPQDLPSGAEQMKVGIAFALITYVLALAVPYGVFRAVVQALLDLACTAIVLHIALTALGKGARFQQAFGGLCGASAFINMAALPLYASRPEPGSVSAMGAFADFVLLVWGLSLFGHVIRHTFEVSLVVSIVISFSYFIVLSSIISAVLPAPGLVEMSSAVSMVILS